MKKKLLTICFVLAAMLSLMTVTASAAPAGPMNAEGLEEAIRNNNAAPSGGGITLGDDITFSSTSTLVITNDLRLDLNGHTLNLGPNSITAEGANLTVVGGSITSRAAQTIAVTGAKGEQESGGTAAALMVEGTTIINTGTGGTGVQLTGKEASARLIMAKGAINASNVIKSDGGTVEITGGVFSGDVSAFLTDKSYRTLKVDNKWVVVDGTVADPVAVIIRADGRTLAQGSLEDAFLQANEENDTIWLMKDIENASGNDINISVSEKITLDLNGHTITLDLEQDRPLKMNTLRIGLVTGKELTIKGGTIRQLQLNGEAPHAAVLVTGGAVVIDGATIRGQNYGVEVDSNGALTVKSGSVAGSKSGIRLNGTKVTVEGGTVTGDTNGIELQTGTLEAKGGSITGKANGVEAFGGSITVTGAAEIGGTHGNGVDFSGGGALTVEGGAITGGINGIDIKAGTLTVKGTAITITGGSSGAGIAASGDVSGSIIDKKVDNTDKTTNTGITVSGASALDLSKCSGPGKILVYGGTFRSTVPNGKSVVRGEVTEATGEFIYGGRFVNSNQKDPIPVEYLAVHRFQERDGTVEPHPDKVLTITFNAGDGTFGKDGPTATKVRILFSDSGVATLMETDLPNDPSKEPREFAGWYIEKNSVTPELEDAIEIKAGTQFKKDDAYVKPTTISDSTGEPNKETYTYDVTVTARWDIKYTITLEAGKGTFQNPGDGWVVVEDAEDPEALPNAKIVRKYDPVQADESGKQTLETTLPEPTREGYGFLGWYKSGEEIPLAEDEKGEPIPGKYVIEDFSDSMTLEARWGLKIIFDAGDGELTLTKDGVATPTKNPYQTVADHQGRLAAEKWPAATSKMYKFVGWYTVPYKSGEDLNEIEEKKVLESNAFTEEDIDPKQGAIVLYAHWALKGEITVEPDLERLVVGGSEKAITLTVDGAKFAASLSRGMFGLEFIPAAGSAEGGDASGELGFGVNRVSDNKVTITLDSVPTEAGILTITVKEGAFAEEIKQPESVTIKVVYKVTFDADGGQISVEKKDPEGSTYEEKPSLELYTDEKGLLSAEDQKKVSKEALTPPTADPGYTFGGWYYRKGEENVKADISQPFTKDAIALKARWGYVVEFYPFGPKSETVITDRGALPKAEWPYRNGLPEEKWPYPPDKEGYAFLGWFEGSGSGAGCVYDNGIVPPGKAGDDSQCTPFAAESGDFDRISFTKNTRLHAHWQKTITVKLNANGGWFTEEGSDAKIKVKEVKVEAGVPLSEDDFKGLPGPFERPTREANYEFVGWYLVPKKDGRAPDAEDGGAAGEAEVEDPKNAALDTILTDGKEIFAYWIEHPSGEYEITFKAGDDAFFGKGDSKSEVIWLTTDEFGRLEKWPDPPTHNDKCEFLGWYTEEGEKVADAKGNTTEGSYPFYKPTTLVAHWSYKITFDLNYKGAPTAASATTDETGKVKAGGWPKQPTREGWTFLGWYTEDGTGPVDESKEFDKSTVLYAHWDITVTLTPEPKVILGDGSKTKIIVKVSGAKFEDDVLPSMLTLNGDAASGVDQDKIEVDYHGSNNDEIEITLSATKPGKLTIKIGTEAFRDGDETPRPENPPSFEITVRDAAPRTVTFVAGGYPDSAQKKGMFVDKNGKELGNEYVQKTNEWGKLPEGFLSELEGQLKPLDEKRFEFDGWFMLEDKEEEAEGGEEGETTKELPVNDDTVFDKDTYVYARWARIYAYDIIINPPNYGSVEVEDGKKTAKVGETVILTVKPNRGYELAELTVIDSTAKKVPVSPGEEENTFTFTMPNDNVTVIATFEKAYSITISPATNGAVEASKETSKKGDKITLTITPAEGYELDALTVQTGTGTNAKPVETTKVSNTIYTFFMPEADVTVAASFKKTSEPSKPETTYTVTVDKEIKNGKVEASPASAKSGSAITLTVAPDEGYELDTLTVTGNKGPVSVIKVNDTKYTFVMPDSDVTVTAAFKEKPPEATYTITIAETANGTVKADKDTAKEGETVTLTVTPAEGYERDKLTVADKDGTSVKVTNNTFVMPASNVTVTATFKKTGAVEPGPGPDEPGEEEGIYSIRIPSFRHGTITTTHTTAESGTRVTLTVVAETDYEVDRVDVARTNGSLVGLSQSGRRYTFTMPTSDVTVDASFSLMAAYNNFVPPQTRPQTQTQGQGGASAPGSLPTSVFKPVTSRPAAALWDIPASSWAYPAAQWAYQNGYLDTAANGTFQLDSTVSHMQLWRIMARWQGESALDDNSVTQWARKTGAARVGAASGAMTRQNIVEYLYQCYFLMGGNVSVTGNLTQYHDNQLVTAAATKNAWIWAVNKGIISGTPDGYLNPNKTLTRAEFASILMRLCQNG